MRFCGQLKCDKRAASAQGHSPVKFLRQTYYYPDFPYKISASDANLIRGYGMDIIEFRSLKKEGPMGEASKEALRLHFDR